MIFNTEYLQNVEELCEQEFIVMSAYKDIGDETLTWTFRMEFTSRPMLTITNVDMKRVYDALLEKIGRTN